MGLVEDVFSKRPENPMIPPSRYIVLKMLAPMKNPLPLAVSMMRLPWMKLPTGAGSDTLTVVFSRVLKLSVRTLEPVPVPLGGWGTRPRLRPILNTAPLDSVMPVPTLSRFRSRPMKMPVPAPLTSI